MIRYFDLDPVKSATSTCLLEDNQGNVFRVYITAPTKKEVVDFVKNKLQTGEVKIDVEVSKLEGSESFYAEYTDPEYEKESPKPDGKIAFETPPQSGIDEEVVFDLASVKIGISRVDLNVKQNYRVEYVIDPPLAFREVRYNGYNDRSIEVFCQAPLGQIGITLLEKRFYAGGYWYEPRRSGSVAGPGVPVYYRADSWYTGEWLIQVEGLNPGGNTYRLAYARTVI